MYKTPDVSVAPRDRAEADLLIIPCFEGEKPEVAGLPEPVREVAEALGSRSGWLGGAKQWAETRSGNDALPVVALQGFGKRSEATARRLHGRLVSAADRAQLNGYQRVAFVIPELAATAGAADAERVCRSLLLSPYRYDRFLAIDQNHPRTPIETLQILAPPGSEETYRRALSVSLALAGAVAFSRNLGNTPGNEASPEWMEAQARELAESHGLAITVLGPEELTRRGMGGILAVGSGSAHDPRLLRLEWGQGPLTVALVGKGVTFDTGGISIKPAGDMDEMKFDKCGACTVLGIAKAVCDLELPVRLRVYVPTVENMPDGAAYRPGDIVRCYNGKTVEITNTDAEGRMILADALAWAVEENPDVLLEYSTLTGASVVALGHDAAALYSPDDGLAGELLSAAEANGEHLWRMPMWPEFLEDMKGAHADLKNSGRRWGSANTAAAFLSQFVGGHPSWAHLDIAGAAYVGNENDEPKGATGYGIPFTLTWLRRRLERG